MVKKKDEAEVESVEEAPAEEVVEEVLVEEAPKPVKVKEEPKPRSLEDFKEIDGFVLENKDKLQRVVEGELGRSGYLEGGLGLEADPKAVLVAYDKKGGLITKDGVKVESGAFFDPRSKQPRKEPKVVLIYNVGGNFIKVNDPSELPGKILELSGIDQKKQAEFAEKKKRSSIK